MIIVTSAGRNGLMTSNIAYNTDLCTVINSKNGSQEPSIVRELYKGLDVTGERNVYCVKPLIITNVLSKDYVMLYKMDRQQS